MSLIGWGAPIGPNSRPGNSGFAVDNESAIVSGSPNVRGDYHCAVIGAHTTFEVFTEWTPLAADASPVQSVSYLGGGVAAFNIGYDFPDFSAGSGTLVITALVDGVLADNELVLVTSRLPDFATYGNSAWSSRTRGDGFWTQRVGTTETD